MYARVDLRLWHDRQFREFGPPPPNPQFLFLYLLTCPERTLIPGVIRHNFSTVFTQFGWSQRAGLMQVAALAEAGMVAYEGDLIWLPNALNHNKPSNPNVVRGWRKAYDHEVPECGLRDIIGTAITVFLRDFPPAFRQAFQAPPKAKPGRARGGHRTGPGGGDGSTNGSSNGSGTVRGTVPRTHLRIKYKYKDPRTNTPPADAGGPRTSPFWAVLRLAQQHVGALQREPETDRMEALKTLCATHGIAGYDGNLCGRVLSDARMARQLKRA